MEITLNIEDVEVGVKNARHLVLSAVMAQVEEQVTVARKSLAACKDISQMSMLAQNLLSVEQVFSKLQQMAAKSQPVALNADGSIRRRGRQPGTRLVNGVWVKPGEQPPQQAAPKAKGRGKKEARVKGPIKLEDIEPGKVHNA